MEISEILEKYETDKVNLHTYGVAYNEVFNEYDRNEKLNILEIGIQKGGSLLAWKEYCPNANVTGIDIVDVVLEKYRTDTVTRIISDIKKWDTEMLFDIIIDDGSHFLGDIVYVICNFVPKLKPNGTLIIEDVQDANLLSSVIINLLQNLKRVNPDFEGTYDCGLLNFDQRSSYDDYMLFIHKNLQKMV